MKKVRSSSPWTYIYVQLKLDYFIFCRYKKCIQFSDNNQNKQKFNFWIRFMNSGQKVRSTSPLAYIYVHFVIQLFHFSKKQTKVFSTALVSTHKTLLNHLSSTCRAHCLFSQTEFEKNPFLDIYIYVLIP